MARRSRAPEAVRPDAPEAAMLSNGCTQGDAGANNSERRPISHFAAYWLTPSAD